MEEKREKGLSASQLTMMAIGSVIGGSFFLGSSVAIHSAGPSIIISYILGGILVYFILFALSEMTANNPGAGSFKGFAAAAYGQGAGFITGWVYWTGMILAMSSEATAISILVKNWFPNISTTIVGTSIIVGVTLVNLLGASRLSKLESSLAGVKLITIVAFILMALLLILGLIKGTTTGGTVNYTRPAFLSEPFFANGFRGLAGSMLIIMFAYAGFEVVGLAASEARQPKVTVPKAIRKIVVLLLSLYIISVGVLLFLIPTNDIREDTSPMVAVLNRFGFGWAGTVLNIVLITAILSTMLASMFGLGRMIRSLADEGQAPGFLKDKKEVPYKGIVFSGICMLLGLFIGLLLPQVYLFLISAGGFSSLFTYAMIMASHIHFRKKHGKPEDKLRLAGFPYSSLFVLLCLIAAIACMPFIKGQGDGLIAGLAILGFYGISYFFMKLFQKARGEKKSSYRPEQRFQYEISKELSETDKESDNSANKNKKREDS
ncbi:amino acid permease [Anaerocolumna chitinilytica]|uniref:Proline-specific permease ProY n=1 Tax=Anaerocolumna chitinilytica TaxID=1727145 RepID=A0A7I8DHR5_9FIRM|nr:amino acid permease [Anaerocolumna chitinilytica]BCJ98048.1 proline-specific permease ProY [Anaerocolumna chitinilytica]